MSGKCYNNQKKRREKFVPSFVCCNQKQNIYFFEKEKEKKVLYVIKIKIISFEFIS